MKKQLPIILCSIIGLSSCVANEYGEINLTWLFWTILIIILFIIWANISVRREKKNKEKWTNEEVNRTNQNNPNRRSEAYQYFEQQRTNGQPNSNKANNIGANYFDIVDNFDFTSVNAAVKGLVYRTDREINRARKLKIRERVFIEHEPFNTADENALKIITNDGVFIGYIEKKHTNILNYYRSKGCPIYCFISKITSNLTPYVYTDVFYNTKYLRELIEKEEKEKEQAKVDAEKQRKEQRENYLDNIDKLNNQARRLRINQLQRNIERTKESIELHKVAGNEKKLNTALDNLKKHQEELDRFIN